MFILKSYKHLINESKWRLEIWTLEYFSRSFWPCWLRRRKKISFSLWTQDVSLWTQEVSLWTQEVSLVLVRGIATRSLRNCRKYSKLRVFGMRSTHFNYKQLLIINHKAKPEKRVQCQMNHFHWHSCMRRAKSGLGSRNLKLWPGTG